MNKADVLPDLLPFHGSQLSGYVVGSGSHESLVVGGIGSHPLDFARLAEKSNRTFFVVQNPFHEGIKAWNSCEPPAAIQTLETNPKKKRREKFTGWRNWWHNQLEIVFNARQWQEFIGHSGASEPILERKKPESLRRITLIGSPTVEEIRTNICAQKPNVPEPKNANANLLQNLLAELSVGMDQEVFDEMLARHLVEFGDRFKEIFLQEDPKNVLPTLERARGMVLGVRRNIEIIFIKDPQFDPWHDEQRFKKIIEGILNVYGVDCIAGHYGHVGDTNIVAEVLKRPFKADLSVPATSFPEVPLQSYPG